MPKMIAKLAWLGIIRSRQPWLALLTAPSKLGNYLFIIV
jgi:hypothetical protein